MKCPLCKTPSLDATVLAPDLEGCICGECNGVWIARTKYDAWRKRLPKDIPETASDAEFSVNDTRVAKICPQCGHLLLPYRVGHGLAFSIDYCGACGGVASRLVTFCDWRPTDLPPPRRAASACAANSAKLAASIINTLRILVIYRLL